MCYLVFCQDTWWCNCINACTNWISFPTTNYSTCHSSPDKNQYVTEQVDEHCFTLHLLREMRCTWALVFHLCDPREFYLEVSRFFFFGGGGGHIISSLAAAANLSLSFFFLPTCNLHKSELSKRRVILWYLLFCLLVEMRG